MARILDEVMKLLPPQADISEAVFEAANIVLYTKNVNFFLDNQGSIKTVVEALKKRVELRADPSLTLDADKSKKIIEKLLPADVGNTNIIFDPQRARVIIEAEKPGLVIGKGGEILKDIKKETHWIPVVRRIPAIRSPLIENIRNVLYENSDYRRKFLHKVGKRIYEGWTQSRREGWIRITTLGAGREVGRSCFLLQTQESRVLLDCGLNVAAQGTENMFPYLDAPEVNLQTLDAVIISHAHLDHVGTLAYLFKMGYRGPVYMTAPTRDVAALLSLDYISLSQKDGDESIYGSADVKEMVKHAICLDYDEVSDITPDIRLTFYDAGHNLGSSLCHLHIGNGLHNFLYSGDFNYETSNLLSSANIRFPRLESVMMESTYGARHDIGITRQESEDLLIGVIKDAATKKGKVLMPVLGVGRSQEIMVVLERAMREGKIPQMPIYLQGMLWDVTAIHTAYPDFFNSRIRQAVFQRDENPFLSDVFKRVVSQKEMQQVVDSEGPCIVMATSGMLTGGASLSYFKHFAEQEKNAMVLTCYQGVGSLGRRLEEGEREINFVEGGSKRQDTLQVKMAIHLIKGFSGHSNFKQLMNWIDRLEPRPKKIMIVHGEYSKTLEFASSVYQAFRIETVAPKNLESIRLR